MPNETVSLLFPAAVRERVLEQHQVLRELLSRSIEATTQSFKPEGPGLTEMADLVQELRTRFRAHLAYEERWLAPVLANLDSWGPERVRELLDEHARQRGELDTLIDGIESHWELENLALALRSLATDLLLDMEQEERSCVSADRLADQILIVGEHLE